MACDPPVSARRCGRHHASRVDRPGPWPGRPPAARGRGPRPARFGRPRDGLRQEPSPAVFRWRWSAGFASRKWTSWRPAPTPSFASRPTPNGTSASPASWKCLRAGSRFSVHFAVDAYAGWPEVGPALALNLSVSRVLLECPFPRGGRRAHPQVQAHGWATVVAAAAWCARPGRTVRDRVSPAPKGRRARIRRFVEAMGA
jgi:hypothetical protein